VLLWSLATLFLSIGLISLSNHRSPEELEYTLPGSYSGGGTGIYSWDPSDQLPNGFYAWTPLVEVDSTIWPNGVDSLDPPDYSGPFAIAPRFKRQQMLSLNGDLNRPRFSRKQLLAFNPDDMGFGGQSSRGPAPHLLPYDPYGYPSIDTPGYHFGTFARHAGANSSGFLYTDGFPFADGFQQYAADAQRSQYELDQARYANWSRAYYQWSKPPPPGGDSPRWTGESPAWYRAAGRRTPQLRAQAPLALAAGPRRRTP
jgi:hypothetical protein